MEYDIRTLIEYTRANITDRRQDQLSLVSGATVGGFVYSVTNSVGFSFLCGAVTTISLRVFGMYLTGKTLKERLSEA